MYIYIYLFQKVSQIAWQAPRESGRFRTNLESFGKGRRVLEVSRARFSGFQKNCKVFYLEGSAIANDMPPGCWGILPMLLYMIPYGCVKLLDPKILNKIQSVLKNAELTLNARRSGHETGKRSSHLVLVIFFWVDQCSIRWVVLQDSHTWSLQSVHINRMSIFFADLIIPTPFWSFILSFFLFNYYFCL